MNKVIQIRGVPDEVHAKLVEAAERAGQSLTAFLAGELEMIAARADLVWHNREVIIAGRAKYGAPHAEAGHTAEVVRKGRAERDEQLARATGRRGK